MVSNYIYHKLTHLLVHMDAIGGTAYWGEWGYLV